MKPYYLPVLVLMACAVNAYPQNSNAQTVSPGVDKSKKPEKEHGPNFANRELSNLEKTSINVSLLPDASNKWNLGSLNHSWKNLYLTGSIFLDGKRFISNKGFENTFLGSQAGKGNGDILGGQNTAVGFESLFNITGGFQNTALGASSLGQNTIGSFNTAIGALTLFRNTTGTMNSAFGAITLFNNTSGEGNTASGFFALNKNTVGNNNAAFGIFSMAGNTEGFANTALGSYTLSSNTTGAGNTAAGMFSMNSNTTGQQNTAYGGGSLFRNTTGILNTAVGISAMSGNTEGSGNTAIGEFSLSNNSVGFGNVALGSSALRGNQIGGSNTAMGYFALIHPFNGFNNTAVGALAGISIQNISNGTLLGAGTDGLRNLMNVTAIGYKAFVFENNQVVVGNTSVTSIGGYANWSNFSDGRYKNNIKEDVPGLNFITQLRPVTYTLNIDGIEQTIKAASPEVNRTFENPSLNGLKPPPDISSGQKLKSEPTDQELKARQDKAKVIYTGFVAQEVEKLANEINYDFSGVDAPENGSGFYSLRYGDFVVPLVKAVQELNKKNEELEQRIQKLELLLLNNEESLLNNKADKKGNESVVLSSARLEQNTPNPSNGSTTIRYYLPGEVSSASIVVSDMKGIVIKNIPLTKKGSGQINIDRGILASGTYSYSLLVDGKQIDSRLMIIAR